MDWATHTTSYRGVVASILTNERRHISISFVTPNSIIAGVIYRGYILHFWFLEDCSLTNIGGEFG